MVRIVFDNSRNQFDRISLQPPAPAEASPNAHAFTQRDTTTPNPAFHHTASRDADAFAAFAVSHPFRG